MAINYQVCVHTKLTTYIDKSAAVPIRVESGG